MSFPLQFSSNAGTRHPVVYSTVFAAQSRPRPDIFCLNGSQEVLSTANRGAYGGLARFAGSRGKPHPTFPQVRIIPAKVHGDRTEKTIIGHIQVLNKGRKLVSAIVTSELALNAYDRKITEKIRMAVPEKHGKSKRIGYLELRHDLKPGPQTLYIEKLDANHETFHGVGSALMYIAMQRHLLLGFELPIRLTAVRFSLRRPGEIDVTQNQCKADAGVSSAPFYYKLGFRPDDEQRDEKGFQIALADFKVADPNDRNRSILLATLLARGHSDRNDPVIRSEDGRSVLPVIVKMHLPLDRLQAQLTRIWKQPVGFIPVPDEWRKPETRRAKA